MSTLHELHTEGYRIRAHHAQMNPSCSRYAELDLPAIIARFGPDFDLNRNLWRLRCTRCGTRGTGMSITVAPPEASLNGYKGR